jgi:hypothetical protein
MSRQVMTAIDIYARAHLRGPRGRAEDQDTEMPAVVRDPQTACPLRARCLVGCALAECHGGGSQCLEFIAREFGECLLAGWLDPAVEGTVERAGSEVRGEARGQVRYAALAECAGQGRGECGALERRAFLQFGVVGDDRQQPGPEFALLSGEAGREGIEGGGDRLKWRGGGCGAAAAPATSSREWAS